jgi:hypothetical protein
MGLEGIGAALSRARDIVASGVEVVQQTVRSIAGGATNNTPQANADAIGRVTAQVVAGQNTPVPQQWSANAGSGDRGFGDGATGGNPAGNDPNTVVAVLTAGKEARVTRETVPGDLPGSGPKSEFVVIDAGAGDDQMSVTRDPKTGDVVVNVNGEEHRFTGADAQRLKIRAGDGNDRIDIASNLAIDFVVEGGAGDDRITAGAGNDRVEGGAGNDTISGGDGRDYVNGNDGNDTLSGMAGNDVVYGGAGDDRLEGDAGDDYLEGSRGNDTLAGYAGADTLSGGVGDDTVEGGAGDDTMYAGQGRDRLFGTSAADTNPAASTDADMFYAQEEDEVAKNQRSTRITVALVGTPGSRGVRIEGTPEFVERVEADLEMLRSSPTGRQMLEAFDRRYEQTRSSMAGLPLVGGLFNDGHTVTIRELPDENNGFAQTTEANKYLDASGRATGGDDSSIRYNTQFQSARFNAPVVVLYHEMSHAYNHVYGHSQQGTYTGPGPDGPVTDASGVVIRPGVNNRERQAVGLDNSGTPHDFDGDPNTAPTTANPRALTENGLRDELRMPPRQSYR